MCLKYKQECTATITITIIAKAAPKNSKCSGGTVSQTLLLWAYDILTFHLQNCPASHVKKERHLTRLSYCLP